MAHPEVRAPQLKHLRKIVPGSHHTPYACWPESWQPTTFHIGVI